MMPHNTASAARAWATAARGERMNQDDYIIRIYRRDPQDQRMVVGTVEQVGEKVKIGFTDFEELRLIMGVPRGQIPRRDAPTPRGDEG